MPLMIPTNLGEEMTKLRETNQSLEKKIDELKNLLNQ